MHLYYLLFYDVCLVNVDFQKVNISQRSGELFIKSTLILQHHFAMLGLKTVD